MRSGVLPHLGLTPRAACERVELSPGRLSEAVAVPAARAQLGHHEGIDKVGARSEASGDGQSGRVDVCGRVVGRLRAGDVVRPRVRPSTPTGGEWCPRPCTAVHVGASGRGAGANLRWCVRVRGRGPRIGDRLQPCGGDRTGRVGARRRLSGRRKLHDALGGRGGVRLVARVRAAHEVEGGRVGVRVQFGVRVPGRRLAVEGGPQSGRVRDGVRVHGRSARIRQARVGGDDRCARDVGGRVRVRAGCVRARGLLAVECGLQARHVGDGVRVGRVRLPGQPRREFDIGRQGCRVGQVRHREGDSASPPSNRRHRAAAAAGQGDGPGGVVVGTTSTRHHGTHDVLHALGIERAASSRHTYLYPVQGI